MRNLHFVMFTTRGLVNRRAVNFNGFKGSPPTLSDLIAEGTRHVL